MSIVPDIAANIQQQIIEFEEREEERLGEEDWNTIPKCKRDTATELAWRDDCSRERAKGLKVRRQEAINKCNAIEAREKNMR